MKRLAVALAVLLTFTASGLTAGIDWPEAVDRLVQVRDRAEQCVRDVRALNTKEGEIVDKLDESVKPQLRQYVALLPLLTQMRHGEAKAHFDGLIAGLITALAAGYKPNALPTLESDLKDGGRAVAELCAPVTLFYQGEVFDRLAEFAKGITDPISAAVAAIYRDYRNDKLEIRQAIKAQLEAAKWPDFDQIKATP